MVLDAAILSAACADVVVAGQTCMVMQAEPFGRGVTHLWTEGPHPLREPSIALAYPMCTPVRARWLIAPVVRIRTFGSFAELEHVV